MNKTIDISLGKILFHLNDTAYYKLKKYLEAVRNSLKNSEDAEEVMNEIEVRIAELLLEKQSHPQQVIDEKDVDEVINVLGQPEDYQEEIEDNDSGNYHVKKKLFRDTDNSAISGVTSGIAHFFGIDISIMRIIFIILLFITSGTFGLIYILLWIVIPKAVSASDKLKMKGERVNIDNIVDHVKAEDTSTSKKKMNIGAKVENTTQEIGSVIIKILGLFIAFISGVVLLSIILSALAISPFSDLHMLASDNAFYHAFNLPLGWISLLAFIVLGFPIGLLFMLGLKMLMPHANIGGNVFLIGGTIWLISVLFVFVKSTSLLAHKNVSTEIVDMEKQIPFQADTLKIFTSKNILERKTDYIQTRKVYYNFKASKNQYFSFKIKKISEGINLDEADESAHKIDYGFHIDSIQKDLTFSSRLSYPQKEFIQEHKVEIDFYIPKDKYVKINERIMNHMHEPNCYNGQLLYNNNELVECIENDIFDEKDSFFDEDDESFEINGEKLNMKISKDSIDIYAEGKKERTAHIKTDKNGVKVNVDSKHKKNDK